MACQTLHRTDSEGAAPAELQPPPGCSLAVCASLAEGERRLAALRDDVARETRALQAVRRRARRQDLLWRESDHRLLNGLQLVASLLVLHARRAASPEAAEALRVAARRVATVGSLHRRLSGRDQPGTLDLAAHLRSVCDELLDMVARDGPAGPIRFEGASLQVPRTVGLPLGFIAAELITNAAKHGAGEILVRLTKLDLRHHNLSVSDQGAGLPPDYDPHAATGLGMKIIESLVRELGADFAWGRGEEGRGGAHFAVSFPLHGPTPAAS